MGKISSLPDADRMAIIGYLAQEGVVREITAEVPLRRCDEFQSKYGVKPYVIRSDKKYSDQLRMILQSVNDSYRSGNVMGFIGCGNERLIIESRFSGEADDFFFQYLLDRVLDFPNLVDLETDANQDNRLFNFLLFLFPHYLTATIYRCWLICFDLMQRWVFISIRKQKIQMT